MKPELYRNTHTNKYRHIMFYLFDYNCSGKCLRIWKAKEKNIKNKKKKNEKILKKFYHNTDRDHNKDSLKL